MKFCFIINPKSGKERFNPLIRRLKALLERNNLAYEFQITTKPGHATALAEKAKIPYNHAFRIAIIKPIIHLFEPRSCGTYR